MSFGSRLKELRIKHNMTQLELAKKINLSKANISKYESDLVEPNLTTLAMISGLFNVSINNLLEISEQNPDISKNVQALHDAYADLNEEELKKVIEYIDFIKSKRT